MLVSALFLSGCGTMTTQPSVDATQGSFDQTSIRAPIPPLRPITSTQAQQIGAWSRNLKVNTGSGTPWTPVAWSMINMYCDARAWALQWAVADVPAPGATFAQIPYDRIKATYLNNMIANPRYDVGTIQITGPLITYRDIKDKNGNLLPGSSDQLYWDNHYGVVLNVNGTLKVLDLSVSDQPVTISQWCANFVSGVTIYQVNDNEFSDIRSYWQCVFNSLDIPPQPSRLCGYRLAAMFTSRSDDQPNLSTIQTVPGQMVTVTGSFKTFLQNYHNTTPVTADIPYYYSVYRAGTITDYCSWFPWALIAKPHTKLTSGTSVSGSVAANGNKYYYINPINTAATLKIQLTGSGGDADLYVSKSIWPTTTSYDYKSAGPTANETITYDIPMWSTPPAHYKITAHGYSGSVNFQIKATVTPK